MNKDLVTILIVRLAVILAFCIIAAAVVIPWFANAQEIAACVVLRNNEPFYMTGIVVKTTTNTYTIDTAEGYYEFPKEDCTTKPYRGRK